MSHDAMPPTRIRATCPGCGEVELTPPDIELRVCKEEAHSFYAFVCRSATRPSPSRPTGRGGAAADLRRGPGPALGPALGDPGAAHRPQLTWDDLLDLHLELESPDWWSRFQAACR